MMKKGKYIKIYNNWGKGGAEKPIRGRIMANLRGKNIFSPNLYDTYLLVGKLSRKGGGGKNMIFEGKYIPLYTDIAEIALAGIKEELNIGISGAEVRELKEE